MKKLILLLLALLSPGGHLLAQSPATVTLVEAAHLLDPRTGNVISPAAVLIENDKIKDVGTPAKVHPPAGAKIIDLGRAMLIPGLIDAHTHLLLDVVVPPEAEMRGEASIRDFGQPAQSGNVVARRDSRDHHECCGTAGMAGSRRRDRAGEVC